MPDAWQTSPYANETYLQSLGASSADVRRQVGNALTEINRQRGVAQARAAQVGGAAKAAFQGAQSALNTDLQGLGIQAPSLGADQRFFSRGAQSYARAGDLLKHGFGEQAAQRAGAARQVQQSILAELAAKANDYIGRRSQEDEHLQFSREEANRQTALQQALQDQRARMQAQALNEQARQAELNRSHQQTLVKMMYPTQYPGPAKRPNLARKIPPFFQRGRN